MVTTLPHAKGGPLFAAFESAFGELLVWLLGAEEDDWLAYGGIKHQSIRSHVASLDEDACIEWHVTSSDEPEALGEYVAACLTERGQMEGECSTFRFQPRSS